MRNTIFIGILLLGSLSCNRMKESNSKPAGQAMDSAEQFDQSMWGFKEGKDYPYRAGLLKDFVYNDTVRILEKNEILDLLGKPDRSTDGYLYYTITQKRIGSWPLHTKSLVIKFSNDTTIEWIKIHE